MYNGPAAGVHRHRRPFTALAALAEAKHSAGGPHHDEVDEDDKPLVIGHRGASGYRPEHTLAAYRLAISDGRRLHRARPRRRRRTACWSPATSRTSAARPTSPSTRVRRPQDAQDVDGADDHGLVHRGLHARGDQDAARDPAARPSARQHVQRQVQDPDVRRGARRWPSASRKRGPVGVYPETKHPTYHAIGLPLEAALVAALKRHGLNHSGSPVFIQSFEQANLKWLNKMTPVQLVPAHRRQRHQPGRSLQYTAPSPAYDWTVSGEPGCARTYGTSTTDAGSTRSRSTPTASAPWKPYIVAHDRDRYRGDGDVDDANGDGEVDEARPRAAAPDRPHPPRPQARPGRPHLDVPQRARGGSPPTTTATRSTSTCGSSSSGSTGCSRTSRTPRSRRATRSSEADRAVVAGTGGG